MNARSFFRKATRLTVLLFLSISIFTGCKCVSRLNVQYKRQQVSPLYFQSIIPSLGIGTFAPCIKWKAKQFNSKVDTVNETAIANKGIWYRSYFSANGYVDYTVVGAYRKESCIILRESNGTLNRAYCLFVYLSCGKVCLKRLVALTNLKDELVQIDGSELVVGNRRIAIEDIKI